MEEVNRGSCENRRKGAEKESWERKITKRSKREGKGNQRRGKPMAGGDGNGSDAKVADTGQAKANTQK